MDSGIAVALAAVGFNYQCLMAGFCGGFVNTVYFGKESSIRHIMAEIIAGGFVANYMHPVVTHFTGAGIPLSAFIAGLIGNAGCHGVVEFVKLWLSFRGPFK